MPLPFVLIAASFGIGCRQQATGWLIEPRLHFVLAPGCVYGTAEVDGRIPGIREHGWHTLYTRRM